MVFNFHDTWNRIDLNGWKYEALFQEEISQYGLLTFCGRNRSLLMINKNIYSELLMAQFSSFEIMNTIKDKVGLWFLIKILECMKEC